MARFRKAGAPYTYSLKPGEGNRGMHRAQSRRLKPQGQETQPIRQARRMSQLEENRPFFSGVKPRIMKPMGTLDVSQYTYMPKSFQSQKAFQSAKNADLAVFKQQYGKGSNRFRRGNK
jgi:hypothetical protein